MLADIKRECNQISFRFFLVDQPEAIAIVLFPPAASSSAGIAQLGESSAVGRQPGPGKGACHKGREGDSPKSPRISGPWWKRKDQFPRIKTSEEGTRSRRPQNVAHTWRVDRVQPQPLSKVGTKCYFGQIFWAGLWIWFLQRKFCLKLYTKKARPPQSNAEKPPLCKGRKGVIYP